MLDVLDSPFRGDSDVVDGWIRDPMSLVPFLKVDYKPLKLFKQQRRMLRMMLDYDRTISVLPRGGGKSFTVAVYVVLRFFLNPTYRVALFSRSQGQANAILETASNIVNHTEFLQSSRRLWEKDQVKRWKGHRGQEVVCLPHDADTAVGYHPDELIMDEVSKYRSDRIYYGTLRPMMTGVQTIDKAPRIHLTSVFYADGAGFFYDFVRKADDRGFKSLVMGAPKCEGWTPERLAKDRKDLGEDEFAAQIMCVPRPSRSTPFSYDLMDKNTVKTVEYKYPHPSFGGLDIAKLRDNAAYLAVSPMWGWKGSAEECPLSVVDTFEGQWDYNVLADYVKTSLGKRAVGSVLVDTTTGEEFVDFGKKSPYNLPAKPYCFGGVGRKALLDFLHIQLEKGLLRIEHDSDLRRYMLDYRRGQHLPDLVAAFALAVWNARGKMKEEKQEYWTPLVG